MNSPLWLTVSQYAINRCRSKDWNDSPLDLAAKLQFGSSAGHACGAIYVGGQRRYLLPKEAMSMSVDFAHNRWIYPTSFRLMPPDGEEAQA